MTTRSTYLQTEDSMTMPSSSLEDGSLGGAAADELVQTTLDDFTEQMIAGKSHAEILAMSIYQRSYYFYRKISPEEKAEAMRIVEMSRRAKMSGENNHTKRPEYRELMSGERNPMKRPEARARISEWSKKLWEDPEHRAKMSGENNVMKKPEIKRKHGAAVNTPEYKAKRSAIASGEKNPSKRPEVRAKQSASMKGKYTGSKASNWQGGISFEPYCPKFNFDLKERIRNVYDRTCLSCGNSEIFNNARLTVHHLDNDKLQGCLGKRWALVPLCRPCHAQLHGAKGQKAIELEFILATKAEEYRRSGF